MTESKQAPPDDPTPLRYRRCICGCVRFEHRDEGFQGCNLCDCVSFTLRAPSTRVPLTVDVPAYIELLELKDKLKDALALAQRDVREAGIVMRAALEGHYQWRTKADEWLHRAAPGEGTDA